MPWDYPFPRASRDPYPLCTSYHDGKEHFNSLHLFNNAMEDPEITDACSKECLPNCGEITYSYEMDTTDLEVDQLCQQEQLEEHTLDTRNVSYHSYSVSSGNQLVGIGGFEGGLIKRAENCQHSQPTLDHRYR